MNRRRRKKLTRGLVLAAMLGEEAEVRRLLRAGADAGGPVSEGTTPLYAASVHGAAAVARMLLEAGAEPDAESGHGSEGTPLCAAACWGHTETVRVLLEYGADPHLREDGGSGMSPLEWALRGPYPETAEVLGNAAAPGGGSRGPGVGCGSGVLRRSESSR